MHLAIDLYIRFLKQVQTHLNTAYSLDQGFSTFLSTVPHYGPSAGLTGLTHVIYILCHQYKQPDL